MVEEVEMKLKGNPPMLRVENIERYTHHDFMQLAPEDKKAELIDGDIFMPPPPFYEHERLQGLLYVVLKLYVDRFNLGQILGSRTAVYISESQTYEPDILFVSRAREHIIKKEKLTEAPDLVVEILSAATAHYDRGSKLANYEKSGVKEAWLIDPYGPAGTQFFQRQADRLVEVSPVDGIIHSITLPNFQLKTVLLWPDENGKLTNTYEVLKELGVI